MRMLAKTHSLRLGVVQSFNPSTLEGKAGGSVIWKSGLHKVTVIHTKILTLGAEAGEIASGSKEAVSRSTGWVPVIPALGESETQGYVGDFQARPSFKTGQFLPYT